MNSKQQIVILALFACAFISACTTEYRDELTSEHETRVEDQVLHGKTDGKQSRPQPEDAVSPSNTAKPLDNTNTLVAESPAIERDRAAPGRQRLHEKKERVAKMKAYAGRSVPASVMQQTMVRWPTEPLDRENYAHFTNNPVKLASEHPVSTFSIDVDSAHMPMFDVCSMREGFQHRMPCGLKR